MVYVFALIFIIVGIASEGFLSAMSLLVNMFLVFTLIASLIALIKGKLLSLYILNRKIATVIFVLSFVLIGIIPTPSQETETASSQTKIDNETVTAEEEKTEEKEKQLAAEQAKKEEERKQQEEAEKKAAAEEKAKAEQEAKEKAEKEAVAKATAEAKKKEESKTNATVTRVIDGDTIEISMNGKEEDVRLLLIDTPETVHPSEPVQPYGPEASQFVKDKLTGEKVRVKIGSEERDKYGRLLAYVFIDGKTIQEMLLSNGLARTAYLYNDLTMLDEFHKAQSVAKNNGIGVWSIPGYAHADHNHGYHYQEEPEPEPEPEPQDEPQEEQPTGINTNVPDKDCGDFSSQQEAQDFMEASGPSDPHRLDGNDNDGLACESL